MYSGDYSWGGTIHWTIGSEPMPKEYDAAFDHRFLCRLQVPSGRGQYKIVYRVVKADYDMAGRHFFLVDDAIVTHYALLPYPPGGEI